MKTIELQILKEDIMTTHYSNQEECAITRALHRAGYPHLQDTGMNIRDNNTGFGVDVMMSCGELTIKVVKMYKYVKYPGSSNSIPPEDFTFSLTLNID